MKAVIILSCLLAITYAVSLKTNIIAEHMKAQEQFRKFMFTYDKQYKTPQEYVKRQQIFIENFAKINELNAQHPLTQYAITKFSDMTVDEFRQFPCGGDLNRFATTKPKTVAHTPKADAPAAWDWTEHGAVTPIKNQLDCGSCWAFSCVGCIEGAWFLAGHPLTNLSEQQFVDCSQSNYGCSGGWPYTAISDMMTDYKGQIDTETAYPYTAEDGTCAFSESEVGATIASENVYCNEQTSPCDEGDMVTNMYTTGPLSVCLDATQFQFYSSGIITDCSTIQIDHCITLIGYGNANSTDFWRVKNSWGTDWGMDGFAMIQRGVGCLSINVAVTGVVGASAEN